MTKQTFGNTLDAILLVILALVLMVATAHCQSAPIQQGSGPFNYGYVTDSARTFLEQGWDTRNAYQKERGYCIEPADVEVDTADDHSAVAWKVHHVTLPDSLSFATPYAIEFHCSSTAIASLHTHTPTSCAHEPMDPIGMHPKHCILGGEDSALCSVDEQDRFTARNDAFIIVQCDKRAFVFWWPRKRG